MSSEFLFNIMGLAAELEGFDATDDILQMSSKQ
jgi:hypothetical protein